MIFITVGTQEPFDRLIKAIDTYSYRWNGERILAQAGIGTYVARNIEVRQFMTPCDFDKYFNEARLIISHAGTGTILKALLINKPILIFPRRACLGEHRNDHQLDTANAFVALDYIRCALNEEELFKLLEQNNSYDVFASPKRINENASEALLSELRRVIF